MIAINRSRKAQSIDEKSWWLRIFAISCQNWLLSQLADLFLKNLQDAISRINSRSFSPSDYIVTRITNRKQHEKGADWI